MTDAALVWREQPAEPRRLMAWLRLCLLILPAALIAVAFGPDPEAWMQVAGLAGIALISSLPVTRSRLGAMAALAEATAAAVVASAVPEHAPAFLPYLLAPCLAAGLRGGVTWAVLTMTSAQAVVVLTAFLTLDNPDLGDYLISVGAWALMALLVGLLGAWVRRLQSLPSTHVDPAYVSAHRLLTELWLVARQLSAGLDPVTLAQGLLEDVQESIPFVRAAVFVRSPGGFLVPLVVEGAERVDWDTTLRGESVLSDAWASDAPVQRPRGFAGEQGLTSGAFALRMGVRSFGLVAFECRTQQDPAVLRRTMRRAQEAALRLETALLFTDVRSIATSEERRRLAREIHDGIAQELTSFGYGVDDLIDRVHERWIRDDLRRLRAEVSRIIGELRLSIFDLRSDVSTWSGLGASLSDYVRQVGAASSLTIHLILDESPQRLRLHVEVEMLRIAQEAITNARKHANAENLWVTCRVNPPDALLRVEDDGVGLQDGRHDSFGMQIMRERAQRIGGTLTIAENDRGGTAVELRLGTMPLDADNDAGAGTGAGTDTTPSTASPQRSEVQA